jgi:hypothetical protein
MDPLTYEALTRNPELIQAIMQQAHRERAEAVHRLIVAPIRKVFDRSRRFRSGTAPYAP